MSEIEKIRKPLVYDAEIIDVSQGERNKKEKFITEAQNMNKKTELEPKPIIERLNNGNKLIYHYPDREKIEVEWTPDYPQGYVHITRKMPHGKIESNSFNRTSRDAQWFFGIRTLGKLKEFIKDKNLGRVLDVGTGKGEFVDDLRGAGVNARGLDIWLDKKQIESGNFILASAHRTGLPDNSFDTIFINTFMHYGMKNEFRKKILKELARILHPRGKILMNIATGEQREFYDSILKDLKLEINASSEFSRNDPRAEKYIEFRKISGQESFSQ